jgi:hypothetical protein
VTLNGLKTDPQVITIRFTVGNFLTEDLLIKDPLTWNALPLTMIAQLEQNMFINWKLCWKWVCGEFCEEGECTLAMSAYLSKSSLRIINCVSTITHFLEGQLVYRALTSFFPIVSHLIKEARNGSVFYVDDYLLSRRPAHLQGR